MNAKKAILIGCGGVTLLSIVAVALIVSFVMHVTKDVEGVAVSVNGPTDVVVGETFELEVVVKNQREKDVLELSDVDIGEEYLQGFTVSSVEPLPNSNMHVPIDNSRSFNFDLDIPPGESQVFVFTLRAETPGIFRGDVDVCEGMQFITDMAETVVRERNEDASSEDQ